MQQKLFIHLIKSLKSILVILTIVQLKRKISKNNVITIVKKLMWDNYQFYINRKPSLKIDTQLAWHDMQFETEIIVLFVLYGMHYAYKYQSI